MSPALTGIILGCLWFGAFFVGHIAVLRLRPSAKPSRVLLHTFFAAVGADVICVLVGTRGSGWPSLILAEIESCLTAACLFVLYGPLFYTIRTSLSVESLLVLSARNGRAPTNDLRQRFASRAIFDGRLATMVASGHLIREKEVYRLTWKGKCIAQVFRALKRLWRLGAGG